MSLGISGKWLRYEQRMPPENFVFLVYGHAGEKALVVKIPRYIDYNRGYVCWFNLVFLEHFYYQFYHMKKVSITYKSSVSLPQCLFIVFCLMFCHCYLIYHRVPLKKYIYKPYLLDPQTCTSTYINGFIQNILGDHHKEHMAQPSFMMQWVIELKENIIAYTDLQTSWAIKHIYHRVQFSGFHSTYMSAQNDCTPLWYKI